MSLEKYKKKRDFAKTPEPAGAEKAEPHPGGPLRPRSFVVQKHAASHLHYDFRLELEGVLKSWSVPKGPSLDPADKRLAMETEDHPMEYAGFEGVIPKGQYGGGTVMVWDRGTWTPREDPHAGWRKGKVVFELAGEKLRGGFALVRTAGRGASRRDAARSWLLTKLPDAAATPGRSIVAERTTSVVTGRDLEAIAAEQDRVWQSNRAPTKVELAVEMPAAARKAKLPPLEDIEAQLPTLVSEPPAGAQWLHEMKYDGYRILARIAGGAARLLSRRGNEWTDRFPAVARALGGLGPREAVIDGEVAVLLPDGTTSFQSLQNALDAGRQASVVYFAFDLLHLDGHDLRRAALEERKAVLERVIANGPGSPLVRYSKHIVGAGEEFFVHACRLKLEGVVAKRRDLAYRPGKNKDWVKVKCHARQELVIGGFTEPESRGRSGIGSLLVGVRDDEGELGYVGRVGTGFTEKTLAELSKKLEPLRIPRSPFKNAVTGRAAPRARWVKPVLVAEVEFGEWTDDGKLRHPSFRGLREDKPAGDVVVEAPAPTPEPAPEREYRRPARSSAPPAGGSRRKAKGDSVTVAGVRITNPDRVLFPSAGITKRALAEYYVAIAEHVLPHVKDRPTTLVRCPEGAGGPCFYQKHEGYWAPESLRRVPIQEQKKVGQYLVVDDVAGLVGLAQLDILEIHTWNSRAADVERPDRFVIDLDPDEGLSWDRVVLAAGRVRGRLAELGLESFVKTTGGKGLHVVVPITRGPSWSDVADFSRDLCISIEGDHPREYTTVVSKARRKNKVFLDWLRNVRGSTSVAAFSTRARANGPVSMPVSWDELFEVRPDTFGIAAAVERARGPDPWAAYARIRQTLGVARTKKLAAILRRR